MLLHTASADSSLDPRALAWIVHADRDVECDEHGCRLACAIDAMRAAGRVALDQVALGIQRTATEPRGVVVDERERLLGALGDEPTRAAEQIDLRLGIVARGRSAAHPGLRGDGRL